MITKQQALEFIYELSNSFSISMDLTKGIDCYLNVYSDSCGIFGVEGELLVDCWYFDHIEDNVKIFQTEGNLQTLYFDLANIDVEKTDRRFEVFGNMDAFLKEIK